MLGELVRPEYPVEIELAHPVFLHVRQEIELTVGLEPLVNGFALVWGHGRAVGFAVGGVGRWLGVVLSV